jgi:hypothetical protein
MTRTAILWAACATALAACASSQDATVESSIVSAAPGAGAETLTLDFINGDTKDLLSPVAGEPQDESSPYAAMSDLCFKDREPAALGAPALAAGVLLPIAGLVIDHVLKLVNESIERELKAYGNAYSASSTVDVYYDIASGRPKSVWNCFRLTRKEGDAARLDLVGAIAIGPNGDTLRLRPLRLYVVGAKAKTTKVGNKVPLGVSIDLAARATWLQDNKGEAADVFTVKLVSKQVDLASAERKDRPFYFFQAADDLEKKAWITAPLPPWSTNATDVGGTTTFTISVAEAGKPPRHLEAFKALFGGTKDTIAQLLKDAIKKALE